MTAPLNERDLIVSNTVPRLLDVTAAGYLATATLYTRTNSTVPPNKPSAAVVYTFATAGMTGMTNGWQGVPPDATIGKYLWQIQAVAQGSGSTVNLAVGSWGTQAVLSKDNVAVGGSLVADFDDQGWNTNAQVPYQAVTDGPVAVAARRAAVGTAQTMPWSYLIKIQAGRTYRTRFYARAAAGTNGTLYHDLRQFLADGSPAAFNSGRSPYKPNAVAAHTDWREYSYTWDGNDWQTNVTQVQPEFLLNYGGTTGYWEVNGYSMLDVTDAIAALNLAGTANSTATTANNNASLALTGITDIGRDDILSPGEKPEINARWNAIVSEYTSNYTQGTAFGLTALRDAMGTAYSNLNTYITGLGSQFYTIPGTAIAMNGATSRSLFQDYYDKRQALLNAIDTEASKRAVWATGISGRPTDAELLNSAMIIGGVNLYPDGGFERGTRTIYGATNVGYSIITGPGPGTGSAYLGTKYLYLDGSASDVYLFIGGPAGSEAPVKAGKQYTISFMYATSGALLADAGSSFFQDDLGNYYNMPHPVANTGQVWTQFSMLWTCPSGVTSIKFRFGFHANGFSWMTVDSIQVEEGNKRTTWSPAAVDVAADTAAAKAVADAAALRITAMSADNVITPDEKSQLITYFQALNAEYTEVYNKAASLGVDNSSMPATKAVLNTYLTGIIGTGYNDPSGDTTVDPTVYRTKFNDYIAAKTAVLTATTAKAATIANWGTVAGRPANIASLTGSENINNGLITLGADGQLNGAGGGGGVTLSGIGLKNWRVVSSGGAATTAPVAFGLYLNGVMMYGGTRSHMLVVIDRATGTIVFTRTYDVYGNGAIGGYNAAQMAYDLNTIGSSRIVVVYTSDEPLTNRLASSLAEALYRHGASRVCYGSPQFQYRSAYILVGIGGCGEGNGAEAYQGTYSNDPNAWCDLGFSVVNGNLVGVSSSFTPKTLADYSYTGSLNATSDLVLLGANTSVSGNSTTSLAGGWGAATYSKTNYTGAAYCEFVIGALPSDFMAGITAANPANSNSYGDITWAIYVAGGTLRVYLNGADQNVSYGNCGVGSVLMVAVDGLFCRMYKDGVVFFTVAITNPNLVLYFDSSFVASGITLNNIKFGPLTNKYGSPRGNATTPDNIVPDPQFLDLTWWNRLGKSRLGYWVGQGTLWKLGTSMYLDAGPDADTLTEWFPMTPGATYRFEMQVGITNDFQGWAGIYWHIPTVAWHTLGADDRGGWGNEPNARIGWDTNSPKGVRFYSGTYTVPDNAYTNRTQIRIRTSISAGNLEWGSLSITRVTDVALLAPGAVTGPAIAPGAVTDTSLGLAPMSIIGLGDVSGSVYKPRVLLATLTPGVINGTGPFRFDWSMVIVEDGDANATFVISTASSPNDTLKVYGIALSAGASQETTLVTCTVTDKNGRSATSQFNVYVSG
jgi:hypothetical protein